MRIEDSDYLTGLDQEGTRRFGANWALPIDEMELFIYECMQAPESIWPEWYKWANANSIRRLRHRTRESHKIKRHLQKRYAGAFRALDAALAAADFVNRSLIDTRHEHGMPVEGNFCLGIDGMWAAN